MRRRTSHRPERVAEAIRQTVATFLTGSVRDPRVGFVTVTAVEVSADLTHARVRVSVMGGDEDKALIEDQDQHARSLGVEGVPFFIFNRRYAVSGAQPAEAILDVMEKAQEELAAAPQ